MWKKIVGFSLAGILLGGCASNTALSTLAKEAGADEEEKLEVLTCAANGQWEDILVNQLSEDDLYFVLSQVDSFAAGNTEEDAYCADLFVMLYQNQSQWPAMHGSKENIGQEADSSSISKTSEVFALLSQRDARDFLSQSETYEVDWDNDVIDTNLVTEDVFFYTITPTSFSLEDDVLSMEYSLEQELMEEQDGSYQSTQTNMLEYTACFEKNYEGSYQLTSITSQNPEEEEILEDEPAKEISEQETERSQEEDVLELAKNGQWEKILANEINEIELYYVIYQAGDFDASNMTDNEYAYNKLYVCYQLLYWRPFASQDGGNPFTITDSSGNDEICLSKVSRLYGLLTERSIQEVVENTESPYPGSPIVLDTQEDTISFWGMGRGWSMGFLSADVNSLEMDGEDLILDATMYLEVDSAGDISYKTVTSHTVFKKNSDGKYVISSSSRS